MSVPARIAASLLAPLVALTTACGASSPPPEPGVIAATRDLAIYRLSSDGSTLRRLSASGAPSQESPTWSPDGRFIAFMSDWPGNGLYTMNAQGHNTRRVVAFDNPESGGIAWAPDNRRIAYGTDVDGLFVLDRTTGRTRQISAEYDSYPSWSPDGRQIAFQHDSTGNGTYSIWIMSTDGTHRRQITHPPGVVHDLSIRDSQPAWSPDGQQIAFQRGYDTWVISLRTRHAHLVARFASAPTWSPSGHTILLSVFRGASSGLFLVSPKGGHLRKVISGQGWALAESSWTRAAR